MTPDTEENSPLAISLPAHKKAAADIDNAEKEEHCGELHDANSNSYSQDSVSKNKKHDLRKLISKGKGYQKTQIKNAETGRYN